MSGGGAAPEWYPVMRAARYLGVAPWELAERSLFWTEAALMAEAAEADAERRQAQRQARQRH